MRFALRDVMLDDVDVYTGMRCDPVMMAELGGPLPPESIAAKVRRDVEIAAADAGWIKMIVLDDGREPETVAGTDVLWSHDDHAADGGGGDGGGESISEIGWMVLPEFQGQGLAKRAARELLRLARQDGRWGLVHAFPGSTNGPSNGICRALGFSFTEERTVTFAGRKLQANHWTIDPSVTLIWPAVDGQAGPA
jgi:RimJ/RimL family protein N-acetyltransferase